MAKAIWKEAVIAESDKVEEVEGNLYFPEESVNKGYLKESPHTTHCPWKGDASYFDVVVEGQKNENAAWTYRTPKSGAENIRNHFSFWKGVTVEK